MSPLVGVIMGSDSDWPTMEPAALALTEFGVEHEVHVVSAHRTPRGMLDYAESAVGRGLKVVIAGAGGAAHLPGMVASTTPLPVIGVPVATVGVGAARNAGLLAVRILGASDDALRERYAAFQASMVDVVREKDDALQRKLN